MDSTNSLVNVPMVGSLVGLIAPVPVWTIAKGYNVEANLSVWTDIKPLHANVLADGPEVALKRYVTI